ncbi:coatomer subunit delta, partial [Elasticomyces elasticus]
MLAEMLFEGVVIEGAVVKGAVFEGAVVEREVIEDAVVEGAGLRAWQLRARYLSVVLAASIYSGTQHTTVEQDNVRFVYQPLDELYMVLITNRQSNILQDIDSLHLFAQVVSSICKSLDEREILRNAFELLSAFDELVTLGYRENLTLSQIKTFLDMESHEERIQEIIARNKELEASEERKRKAKQLEMQRKEMSRSGRGNIPRTPTYPTYAPPTQPTMPDTYDYYTAEKNKTLN